MPPGLKLQFCLFSTQRIYMFHVIFIVNSDYVPIQYSTIPLSCRRKLFSVRCELNLHIVQIKFRLQRLNHFFSHFFLYQLNALNMLDEHIYPQLPPTCFCVFYIIFRETIALLAQNLCYLQKEWVLEQVTQQSP